MKKWMIGAVLAGILVGRSYAATEPLQWLTDIRAAKAKAKEEKKFIMLDFTGSDWCGWCIKLKNEVFDQPDFSTYARSNLVLVEIDFPHNKYQNPVTKAANAVLAGMYHIQGYPTIVVLDKDGEQVGECGYTPGGPKAFIGELMKMEGAQHTSGAIRPDFPPIANGTAPTPPAANAGVPTSVPNYGALTLKAISGTKDRRVAMINNQTFLSGETAKVKVQDLRVDVVCKEIRADSVLVTVDGKQMELKLAAK